MEDMYDPSGRDWPHDPDGDAGSEGGRNYGMAVITKKVDEDEDFPLDVEEFLDEHGEDPVRLNYERVVSVNDVFEHVEGEEFETKVDMWKAVGEGMREGGMWEFKPTA